MDSVRISYRVANFNLIFSPTEFDLERMDFLVSVPTSDSHEDNQITNLNRVSKSRSASDSATIK